MFHAAFGQSSINVTLKGSIVDADTRQPLPGANIMLSGTMLGTSSDLDGNFEIMRIPAGNYSVKATMMGFKSQSLNAQIQAGQTTVVSFSLKETVIETPALVVTAGKRAQSFQDVSNSVSLVSASEIRKKNRLYLDEILEYTPGVNVLEGDVNIRGSSGFSLGAGSRVLLLVDGIPMMPGDSGDIKWDILPVSQIDRVEVVKGAGSALYGSHALGGVINIISKEPSAKPLTNIKLSGGVYDKPYYEEWEWTDKTLYYTQADVTHSRMWKNTGLLFSAGRVETTGYQQNGEATTWNFLGRLDTRFTPQSRLTIQGNMVNGDYGEIFLWKNQNDVFEMPVTSVGDWVNSNKYSLNAVYRHLINQKFTYKIRTSYFHNNWQHYYHDNDDFSKANKLGLELQGDYLLNSKHALTFGLEGIYDNTNSALFGDHDATTWALFAQDDIRISSIISATLGMRFDHHSVDTGLDDNQFNPKLGFTIKPSVISTIRASVGRGFRSPTMAEMFTSTNTSGFRVIPNPNLKAERAWSFEVGFNQILSENILLDIALFQNDYWNFIEPLPDAQNIVQFINVNRARIRGFEFMAQSSWWRKKLDFMAGYTLLDPKDIELDEILAYRPEHLLTAALSLRHGLFETGIDYRYVSRVENVKVYPDDDRVPHHVLDGRVGASFGSYTLTLNVNNILNYNYTQIERNLAPIRHYTLTLLANL
jgi:iron complex outermembrane receptor protein